jgi:general nucleoside transport system permease protein
MIDFWETVLAGGVRLAVPVGLAATGELLGERAGVLNLGIEGVMAMGAIGGVMGAVTFGTTGGLVVGAFVGALVALVFSLLTVRLGADELICGFAVALGGAGLAIFLSRVVFTTRPDITPYGAVRIPGLSSLPVVGPALFDQPLVIWLLPIAIVAVSLVFTRTRVGLALRAAGEGADAARTRGIDVDAHRIAASVAGGALAGLGGAVLCVGLVGEFSDTIIGGRGFLALALVIAARWRPGLLLPAVLGIGTLQALQLRVQATGSGAVPVELLQALPYLATLLVLAVGLGASQAPRALGQLTKERRI